MGRSTAGTGKRRRMTTPSTLLLTEDEAARALKLCKRTLRKARQQGDLAYVLIGRAVRYTLADLQEFIASTTIRQETPCPQPRPAPRRTSTPRRAGGVIVPFTQRRA